MVLILKTSCSNDVINNALGNTGQQGDIVPSAICVISDAQESDKHLKRVFRYKQTGDFQQYQISILGDVKVITDEEMEISSHT